MPDDVNYLKEMLLEVYRAGFEAGATNQDDLMVAFESWWQEEALRILPPPCLIPS